MIKTLSTVAEADELIELVKKSASHALSKIQELPHDDAMQSLWYMKSGAAGCDPLNHERSLNLVEQLNQSFTYVASALAVKRLFELHPGLAPFTLNLGTTGGNDIASADSSGLAAEVFAAARPQNNQKLKRDIDRLAEHPATFKYVFFMCPKFTAARQRQLETRTNIEVWSVGNII